MTKTSHMLSILPIAALFYLGIWCPSAAAQATGPIAGAEQSSTGPMRIRFGADVPTATSQRSPAYPQVAIEQRIEGNVVLHLVINGDGTVKEVTVVSGPSVLSDSALETIKSWRYQPVRLNGSPVETDTTVTLNYVLSPTPAVLVNSKPRPASSSILQTGPDSPATKEDVERYLDAVHSHDMMKQMMEQMSKPLHQNIHDQLAKSGTKVSPDFEARMDKMLDDMFNDLPLDDMMQAMVPVYQKHFTKGDIDTLIAFYSAPTGQKMLREMPAIMAEAMQNMMPIMQKHIEAMTQRIQQDVAKSLQQEQRKASQNPPVTRN